MQPPVDPDQYLAELKETLLEMGDPEVAEGQMRYMKGLFAFYGVKAPRWLALSKEWFKTKGFFEGDELVEYVRLSMQDEYREVHYFAFEMFQRSIKWHPESAIDLTREWIVSNSWWDTVDWLAKLAGMHFKRFSHLLRPVVEVWIDSDNMWLQRAAIICQRFHKQQTDEELLFDCIRKKRDSKEFFIQKGAGWALREYSKVAPEAVLAFVETEKLPALTKREALRLMKNSGFHINKK